MTENGIPGGVVLLAVIWNSCDVDFEIEKRLSPLSPSVSLVSNVDDEGDEVNLLR